MSFDMQLYDRQVGVFGVEACVESESVCERPRDALSANLIFPFPPTPFQNYSMGKLIQMDVLLIGLRGLGVETGELQVSNAAH
jgi:hypothetical protein